jgi:hypothetical protein
MRSYVDDETDNSDAADEGRYSELIDRVLPVSTLSGLSPVSAFRFSSGESWTRLLSPVPRAWSLQY